MPVPSFSRHFMRGLAAGLLLAQGLALGQPDTSVPADPAVRALVEQNRLLQQQVQSQQKQIDELRDRLDRLQKTETSPASAGNSTLLAESPGQNLSLGDSSHPVRISGETGLAFFSGGSDSAFPNSEFRIDDSKIFIEAPVWHSVYFFGELDLMTRENNDKNFHLGELYLDMEDILSFGRKQGLTLRAGRFNIPFGEEYQYRGVMANPLISHSASDIWGYDTGVEVYGNLAGIQYNLAVQDGGLDKNKALTARLGYDPVKNLHLSVSAHDTGRLSVVNDYVSQIWFGGAFFRGLAPAADASSFEASVFEADADWNWNGGHFRADGGVVHYDDNSPTVDNSRRLSFYSFEAVQRLAGNLSGALRFSEIRAPGGYPLMGQADGGEYFYNPFAPLTTDLQRISTGLSYRFGEPFIWKVEYSWESGHFVNGGNRDNEDLLSTEIGIRF